MVIDLIVQGIFVIMLVGFGVSLDCGYFSYNLIKCRVELYWLKDGDVVLVVCIYEWIVKVVGLESQFVNINKIVNSIWYLLGGVCIDVVCDLEGCVKG